jgi:hypothetical protein
VQWAWEFLRRNREYQQVWFEVVGAEIGLSESDPVSAPRQEPTSPGRRARVRLGHDPFREKFHVATPPPPPWEPVVKLHFTSEFIPYDANNSEPVREVSGDLKRGQIVVWLDLGWPINRQLENAKKVFKMESTRQGIASEPRRKRLDKYRDYLRVLDASEAGVPPDEIAAAIFGHIKNEYPEYTGRHAVHDALNAATRLRDHNYWRIAQAT